MLHKAHCDVYTVHFTYENQKTLQHPPEVSQQPSSRVLRLVNDTKRFLYLSFHKKIPSTVLQLLVENYARNGFQQQGKIFRLLPFTDSDLKKGRIPFFLEDSKCNVSHILNHVGNLLPVYMSHGPGKYIARMALGFSSTINSADIPRDAALCCPDIQAANGSLTSDGCGMLRESFARKILRDLDLPASTSVLQGRWGGVKGTWVITPDTVFDSICQQCGRTPSKYNMVYRPSMFKFEGGPTILEVLAISRSPSSAKLNKQFVLHLLSLGVPKQVFTDLIQARAKKLDKLVQSTQESLRVLEEDSGDELGGMRVDAYELLKSGHSLSDPHVFTKLQSYRKSKYKELTERLAIPIEKSCYVIGVLDVQHVLKDDEVYINIPSKKGVLKGPVLVTRMPCYFSSDLRVLKAVDNPQLKHLLNCIVFPQGGRYSIPDAIASGDLDGDHYFICWAEDLLPRRSTIPCKRSQSPAVNVNGVNDNMTSLREEKTLTRDLIDYFVRNRHSPLLGCVHNEWQDVAEHHSQMTDSAHAQELGALAEILLDSNKNGANMSDLKTRFRTIASTYSKPSNPSILDSIRECVPTPNFDTPVDSSYSSDPDLDVRRRDAGCVTRWDEEYAQARNIMPKFNRQLVSAIDRDRMFEEKFNTRANMVTKEHMQKYYSSTPPASTVEKIRASAWYHYGYSQRKPAFAWLGVKYLNDMKYSEIQKKKSASTQTPPTLLVKRGQLVGGSQRPSINPLSLNISISNKTLPNIQARVQVSSGTSSKLQPAPIQYPAVKQPLPGFPPHTPAIIAKDPPPGDFKAAGTKPPAGASSSQATPEGPGHPVATPNIPACSANNGKHSWSKHANKYYRGYTCENMNCGVVVKEYKVQDGRGWVSQTEKNQMNEDKKKKRVAIK